MSNYSSHNSAKKDAGGLPVYGMDLELQAKQEGKRSVETENEVRDWIKAVSGQTIGRSFEDDLKNGVILCNLINRIVPNKIRSVYSGGMPFKQMENIASFVAAASDLGVPQHDNFMTVDLFEAKNIPQVVQCLYALGRSVSRVPGYNGPTIGPKLAEGGNVRHFEVRATGDTGSVSKISQGSSGGASQAGMRSIRHEVVKTNNVGDTTATTKLSQGSSGGASQAGTRSISHEIVKTTGSSTNPNASQSRQTQGSHGGASQAGTRSISNEIVRTPAASSSTNPPPPAPTAAASGTSTGASLADLEKLANLRDRGIITAAEFEAKKRQILGL